MERETFAARFAEAAERARQFARDYVVEPLEGDLLFRLDTKRDLDGAINALWRDGMTPVWTDLCVTGQLDGVTIIGVERSPEFTAGEGILGVVGPTTPVRFHKGDHFSVHRRAWCWDEQDLEHLRNVHEQVHSLDSRLPTEELPVLPAMEELEQESSTSGDPIAAAARFPALHSLTVRFGPRAHPTVSGETPAPGITSLHLAGLPDEPWGCAELAHAVPNATSVHLEANESLWLKGTVPPRIERIAFTARRLEGDIKLPPNLSSLSVSVDSLSDEDFAALISGVEHIEALHLRGTHISDELALLLAQRLGLEFLDVVDTGITRETIDRIAAQGLRLLPDYSPH